MNGDSCVIGVMVGRECVCAVHDGRLSMGDVS